MRANERNFLAKSDVRWRCYWFQRLIDVYVFGQEMSTTVNPGSNSFIFQATPFPFSRLHRKESSALFNRAAWTTSTYQPSTTPNHLASSPSSSWVDPRMPRTPATSEPRTCNTLSIVAMKL